MDKSTYLVTGASRGIGLATARHLARQGHNLVLVARSAERLSAAAEALAGTGSACETVPADVSRPEEAERVVHAALARFGRLDGLINNAGFATLHAVEAMPLDVFEQTWRVNAASVFAFTRAVWPQMKKQGGGVIVNVSSVASVDPFPGLGIYGACKAWVNLFTRVTAAEGKPLGIRAYAVAPGAVETPMLRSLFPDYPADQALRPEQVAEVIGALCAGPFAPVSGQTIFVRA